MTRSVQLAALAVLTMAASAPVAAAEAPEAAAKRCHALGTLQLRDTSIVSAAFVPARAAETTIAGETPGHRSFCRVVARVKAAPDSDIGVEIWLPVEGWTGVFHGNGNGGFAGVLAGGYAGMAGCGEDLRPRRPTPERLPPRRWRATR
jgi:feruloyl esterase